MVSDRRRTSAYHRALQQAVKPGSVVIDIGTGTGIFAFLACQLGAARVYAIEPNDAILVAQKTANANGFADRIRFIPSLSTQTTIPERADVIVSDLHGVMPMHGMHIPAVVDARDRFLASGGSLIPQRDTLWAVIAETPESFDRYDPLSNGSSYGLDLEEAMLAVRNSIYAGPVNSERYFAGPQEWGSIDYGRVTSPNVSGRLLWKVERNGEAGGLGLWFNGELADGVSFTNAPHEPALVYGSLFLPWLKPVSLRIGDTVASTLRADLVGDGYVWTWETRVLENDEPQRVKANFRQSTFFGRRVTEDMLATYGENFLPAIGLDGEIDRVVLNAMDGRTCSRDISIHLHKRFPNRFSSVQSALNRVARVARKYCNRRME